jgi:hypothetical protein
MVDDLTSRNSNIAMVVTSVGGCHTSGRRWPKQDQRLNSITPFKIRITVTKALFRDVATLNTLW